MNRAHDDPAASAAPGSEPHSAAGRLNWLRAGVLGANDGIVSVAGIVVGVAGATSARGPIFTAGLAGLVAGAVSMALGEYVSVSSQRDSQDTLLAQKSASIVAAELTAHDASAAHLDAELHLDPDDLANPLQAAAASATSFIAGRSDKNILIGRLATPERQAGHCRPDGHRCALVILAGSGPPSR
jgi:vacuolar iron transporter family protein